MKKILWLLLLLIIAVFGSCLFEASDVAKLEPVEVIRLSVRGDAFCVETDTGQLGLGATVEEAFANLKASASGDIFLDTADYLILTTRTAPMVRQMRKILRPACRVCLENGNTDMEIVADFLNIHEPQLSLMQCYREDLRIPILKIEGGRMELVS